MRADFLKLVPERVKFDQFWVEIRKRNRWLILLRYGAVVLLTTLIIGILILQNIFPKFYFNTIPLWIIAGTILLYNLLFHFLWHYLSKKRKWYLQKKSEFIDKGFHSLHFSLLQICFDLAALLLFIYYTGGVETPLFVFFIFHIIIGSLFLPGEIIALLVTLILGISITGSILELNAIIPHHAIAGFLDTPLYNNHVYLIFFFGIFGIALYLSVYLANSIAMTLYKRERSLTAAYDELENAEKSKSRYVQAVVHDLKTPIAATLTYIDMILEGNLGEVPRAILRPIERSKIRLSNAIQTINDILHISQIKLESGLESITKVNLIEIFDEIHREILFLIENKGISYSFIADDEEELNIISDPKLLKLAISNLLSNAYKYTDSGGKIQVKLIDNRDNLIISIADSGIGIPESELGKIFNPFYRTSVSKNKGIEGSGLGLSIVAEIVEKFNGKIEVKSPSFLSDSMDKPGTEFIITLPKIFELMK